MTLEHSNWDSAMQHARGSDVPPETQEGLRWSEFRYRTVASMAPGFIFEYRFSAAGKPEPVWASEGIEAILGCTLEETERRGGFDSLTDEEWKPLARARQARLLQGEAQSGELRMRSIAGERKWLHISMQPVLDPRTHAVTGVVGSAYDITTRKVAEQAVRESEAVLRAVTENTPDWLFLIDQNLRVRFMNRPFGPNRPENVLGRGLLEFIPEGHRTSMEELYRKVLATGVPARLELHRPSPEGILSHYEHRVMPVIESGIVRSLTVAVTDVTERNNDVTERKQLEREIIEIANREQQRIGSDLHDGLGQDLTGIALMLKGVVAQLRKEGSATRRDVEEVIGLVNNAIESTRTLARGLSPVSGGSGGLGVAIQTLAARVSERFGVRVNFHSNFAEPLLLGETAATHVYRIVQEALTNVVRHSRATEVAIRLDTSDGELHLNVDDNGRGFSGMPTDRAGGLGLKIMRYRAQMLGGDLVIDSAERGGASVRCSCPLDLSEVTEREDGPRG
jgi:two-component system sensor histidine kinase UhpB